MRTFSEQPVQLAAMDPPALSEILVLLNGLQNLCVGQASFAPAQQQEVYQNPVGQFDSVSSLLQLAGTPSRLSLQSDVGCSPTSLAPLQLTREDTAVCSTIQDTGLQPSTPFQHPLPAVSWPSAAQLQPIQTEMQWQQPLRSRKSPQHQDLEKIRRTVYVCDVDQQVSEGELSQFFQPCGQIVECRICGDPNSSMRFAFIEFLHEEGVRRALEMSGRQLGLYPLRVAPSKTAIVPVKSDFLPVSITEKQAVARTVYVANIDRMVERDTLHTFFSRMCGPITKLRLLGDTQHASKIAFVEFELEGSARLALNCTGAILGSLPLRVSPSKTPVRLDARRLQQRAGGGRGRGRQEVHGVAG